MATSNMSSLNPHNIGETRRISTCSGYSTGPGSLYTAIICSKCYFISELVSRQGSNSPRRISAASSASGYYSDDKERTSFDGGGHGSYKSQHWRYSFRRCKQSLILVIGFILHLQMRRKKETPRKTRTVGRETGGAFTTIKSAKVIKTTKNHYFRP